MKNRSDNSAEQIQDDESTVNAEMMFISKGGKNPYNEIITSNNIKEFLPDEKDITFLKNYFEEQQIRMTYYSGITASLVGSKDRFEKLFQVKLLKENRNYFIEIKDKEPNDLTILPKEYLPKAVREKIGVVSIPQSPETFR